MPPRQSSHSSLEWLWLVFSKLAALETCDKDCRLCPNPPRYQNRSAQHGHPHLHQWHAYPRDKATVSVFDSGFILGDGVWEGLRLVDGGVPFLYAHVERLYEGAKAIFMDVGISPEELVKRLFACIDANKMRDGVHIRMMVTRGVKATPYQDPRVTISPATIVIIPEYKSPSPEKFERGTTLHTVRCGAPDVQDQSSTRIEAQLHHRLRASHERWPTRHSCLIPWALSPPAIPPTSLS
jgi:hypothetical protein